MGRGVNSRISHGASSDASNNNIPQDGENVNAAEKLTRKDLHQGIIDDAKAKFAENGFDFDEVLKNAKNLSTFATVDNTPQRVMEKALGYRGLKDWDQERGFLMDTCLTAQERFKAYLDYFRISY